MVQNLYDKNIIIYTFIALCALGVLLRIAVNLVYKHLVKESDRLGETKNKMLMHLKMKFSTCYKLKIGVNNVDTFVDKNVLRYRFCGLLLSTWDNAGGQVLFLNLLMVPVLSVFGVAYGCGQNQVLLTGAVGILTSAILILVDKSINITGKKRMLRLNLLDYLENFCKVRLEQEAVHPEMVEQYRKEYYQAVEAGKQTGAAVAEVKEEPKDELNRRREARLKKEEEKRLLAQKREEEQRKAEEARREEEKKKFEERRQMAVKRREEERLKMEEERAALEARRAEIKRKAEEKQLANTLKQQKEEEKEKLIHSLQEDIKPAEKKTDMNTLIKGVEEIAAEKEQAAIKAAKIKSEKETDDNALKEKAANADAVKESAAKEKAVKESAVKENAMPANAVKESGMKEKQQKASAKNAKSKEITVQEEKLIEDVLKEFFA